MIIDISPPITPSLRVFPGDTPMSREVLLSLEAGANITLSTLRSTVHLGSHADGPNHYVQGGASIDEVPLERYVGPCQVVAATMEPDRRVGVDDIDVDAISERRVLIRTDSYPDPTVWTESFAGLEPELVRALAARDVMTIGVDTPSVDSAASKDLPAHGAFAETGLVILEGLMLGQVAPGRYELIALPLKLVGFDGSPVRAILRPLD